MEASAAGVVAYQQDAREEGSASIVKLAIADFERRLYALYW
jgi:hypothetical protein